MTMSGPGHRRNAGVWIAIALAVVVALGVFKGVVSVPDVPLTHGEAWVRADGTIVVKVLGPSLY